MDGVGAQAQVGDGQVGVVGNGGGLDLLRGRVWQNGRREMEREEGERRHGEIDLHLERLSRRRRDMWV